MKKTLEKNKFEIHQKQFRNGNTFGKHQKKHQKHTIKRQKHSEKHQKHIRNSLETHQKHIIISLETQKN